MSTDATLRLCYGIFTPMLDETQVAWNPVFHTSHPVTTTDFADTEFTNNYVDSIKQVTKALHLGFEQVETKCLSKDQWLHLAA